MSGRKPTGADRLKEYVDGVLSGKQEVPVFVRRSVDLWQKSHDRWRCDWKAFNRVVGLIELMPRPEGSGRLELFPWQCYVLSWLTLFREHDTDKRATKEFFLAVPRKAGKSSLLGAYALTSLMEPVGNYQSPLILCFGINEETARMTYQKARNILIGDRNAYAEAPKVRGRKAHKSIVKAYGMKEGKLQIRCGKTNGTMKPLSAGAHSLQGFTAEMVIADEISQLPNTQGMDALRAGFAMAHSRQFIMTSTPDCLPWSAYDAELERAMRWLGMKPDGSDSDEGPDGSQDYAALIYAATEDDDHGDPKVWERTQPSYRHFISNMKTDYELEWSRAQSDSRAMHSFKTLKLCVPSRLAGSWITLDDWEGSPSPPPRPERKKGWWTFVGVDLSDVKDTTAICVLQVNPEEDRQRVWFEVHYPEGSLPASSKTNDGQRAHIENDALLWAEEGWLILHEGRSIDHARTAERMVELNKKLNPIRFVSDTYSALDEMKMHCTPQVREKFKTLGKSYTTFTSPVSAFSSWVNAGTAEIQKHPVATRHFRNAQLVQGKLGGVMLEKPTDSSTAKIDAMDALMCAVAAWLRSQDDRLLGSADAPHPGTDLKKPYGMRMVG